MIKLRSCSSSQLNTGVSKCPPDFGKMKGAILVEPGTKLPAELTAETLEKLVHADRPERVYGIATFVEFAPNGGEVQTSANGYGPEQITGLSARRDNFTLNKYYPELHASLTKTHNKEWDVYFFDENYRLYGINDGSDTLAGFPMDNVYSDATPVPTSSEQATMSVNFSYKDAKEAATNFDYVQLDFNPLKVTLGLTAVKLAKVEENEYKLYEVTGRYDVTSIYGPLLTTAGQAAFDGTSSAVTYNESTKTMTITSSGEVKLKSPKVLYDNEIKGIEGV